MICPTVDLTQNLHIGVDKDFITGADEMNSVQVPQALCEDMIDNVMARARGYNVSLI